MAYRPLFFIVNPIQTCCLVNILFSINVLPISVIIELRKI